MNLTEGALDALRHAVADHHSIRMPIITDRKVYLEVDRALTRLAGGGRWDRRERAHVYDRDPRPDLEQLTDSTVIPPPNMTRDKEMSYWPTPPALAKELVAGLDLPDGARVLEPSAGDGCLVQALRAAYPHIHIDAVEPDPGRLMVLRMAGTVGLHVFDTTLEDYTCQWTAGGAVGFDAVVMNPPFTLPGRRYAWAEHLVWVWELLAPGGQLRAIVPASLEFGRQRPIAAARALLSAAGGSWRPAPAGAFTPSGTNVHALIVEATRKGVT